MGCGASVPQNANNIPPTRVAPAGQAVSEANALNRTICEDGVTRISVLSKSSQGRESLEDRKSLEKVLSLTDRATPQEALQSLLAGNERFITGTSTHPHQDFARIQQISDKQKPFAAVLGCADSRVPAEIVFDQGFGDVFVCRVAGNIATPEQLASLEYAVLDLGVKVVMVLGHTNCGAVKAALSGKPFPGFIDTLVGQIDVAIARVDSVTTKGDTPSVLDMVVKENVKYQFHRCQRSAIIRESIEKGSLVLVGAVYDLGTGKVNVIVTKGGKYDL